MPRSILEMPADQVAMRQRSCLIPFLQLLQAYMRGMTYPRYVFLSYYWYSEFWWRDPITRGAGYAYEPPFCTAEELERAIYRSVSPDYFPEARPEDVNVTSDVGYVSIVLCVCVHAQ